MDHRHGVIRGKHNLRSRPWLRPVLAGCLGLLLCLWLAGAPSASAQAAGQSAGNAETDELTIQRLRVQVMPEFDDPRVLVIVQGRLAVADSALPMPVTFRLPRDAQINQMAAMDMATGATASRPYEVQPHPEDPRWSSVTFTLDNAHFFYEYYYDPIAGESDKTFRFSFSSLQPVADLLMEVQQPLEATQFATAPSASGTRVDHLFNFTYHQFAIGSLAAGEEATVQVSYTKTHPAPSLSPEQVMQQMGSGAQAAALPPVAAASLTASRATGIGLPLWVFILLAGVVLLAGAGFAGLLQRPQPLIIGPAPNLNINGDKYCTQCGARLKANARFCHICGAG